MHWLMPCDVPPKRTGGARRDKQNKSQPFGLSVWRAVPRMLRSAISAFTRVFEALWRCAADPGSNVAAMGPGSAAQRFTLRRVRDTGSLILARRQHIQLGVGEDQAIGQQLGEVAHDPLAGARMLFSESLEIAERDFVRGRGHVGQHVGGAVRLQ